MHYARQGIITPEMEYVAIRENMKYTDPKADLPGHLPLISRKATIVALLLLLFLSLTFIEANVKVGKSQGFQKTIEIEDIPITKQKIEEPPKPKPKAAEVIEAEEEEEADTVTIAETDLVIDSFIPEFIEDDDEVYDFFAVEEQATIKHQEPVKYPEFARKAGVEGTVLVEVVIDKSGFISTAVVVGVRPEGVKGFFEDEALKAARKFKFNPAKQRGKPVKVKKRIPFQFKLNS